MLNSFSRKFLTNHRNSYTIVYKSVSRVRVYVNVNVNYMVGGDMPNKIIEILKELSSYQSDDTWSELSPEKAKQQLLKAVLKVLAGDDYCKQKVEELFNEK